MINFNSLQMFFFTKLIDLDNKLEFASFNIEEAELKIANCFSAIDEITAIYTQIRGRELRVFVFINTQKYDDELMDKLLNIEYNLHNLQMEDDMILLSFSYIPKIYKNRNDILHPNSKLIFEKQNG